MDQESLAPCPAQDARQGVVGKRVEGKGRAAEEPQHQDTKAPIGARRQPLDAPQSADALEHGGDEEERDSCDGELGRSWRKDERPAATHRGQQVGERQEGRRQQEQRAGLPERGDDVRD